MDGVALFTVPTREPADLSGLAVLHERGLAASDIVAVVGKTEGNGCVNDFSRTLAAMAWTSTVSPEAITVFSGGTEGVLSPHVNLFVTDRTRHDAYDRGLVAAAGRSRRIDPEELGRAAQLDAVCDTVNKLVAELGVTSDDVHLVLVKCPLFTSQSIAATLAAGLEPICVDTYASMGHSRAASALGVAVALGETTREQAIEALYGRAEVWSSRASASSGAELQECHVLVLAHSSAARNPLRAMHATMTDALDITSINIMMEAIKREGGTVRQIFAKAEPDPSGAVRGYRHTMLTDSDIHATRHARAAVGGLLSALKGDGGVYVSGGAEHQGPPGGGGVTVIYELPPTT